MPLNKSHKRYIQYDTYVRIKNMKDKAILFMATYLCSKGIFKILGNDKCGIEGSFYTFRVKGK